MSVGNIFSGSHGEVRIIPDGDTTTIIAIYNMTSGNNAFPGASSDISHNKRITPDLIRYQRNNQKTDEAFVSYLKDSVNKGIEMQKLIELLARLPEFEVGDEFQIIFAGITVYVHGNEYVVIGNERFSRRFPYKELQLATFLHNMNRKEGFVWQG